MTGACAAVMHVDHNHVDAAGEGHYDLVVHGAHEHRVIGTDDTVTVTNVNAQDTGWALANEYCSRLGKTAEASRSIRYVAIRKAARNAWDSQEFDCVSGR